MSSAPNLGLEMVILQKSHWSFPKLIGTASVFILQAEKLNNRVIIINGWD